jgi:hypothetical protein
MKKRLMIVLSALLVVSMILSACAKTDTSQLLILKLRRVAKPPQHK